MEPHGWAETHRVAGDSEQTELTFLHAASRRSTPRRKPYKTDHDDNNSRKPTSHITATVCVCVKFMNHKVHSSIWVWAVPSRQRLGTFSTFAAVFLIGHVKKKKKKK